MFKRLSNSWELVKASAAVLQADKELMVFPIISAALSVLVLITFAVPSVLAGLFDSVADAGLPLAGYIVMACTTTEYPRVGLRWGWIEIQPDALAVVELEAPAGERVTGYLDARGPRLAQEFLDRGVLLRPLGNVIYFLPPYAITDDECHRVFDILEDTLLGSRRMTAR